MRKYSPPPESFRQTTEIKFGKQSELTIRYCGDISLLKKRPVAIIGTRMMSPDANALALRLAAFIAPSKRPIATGLAMGSDYAAGREASIAKIPLIGWLPCGLDLMTPLRSIWLAKYAWTQGLLCSLGESDSRQPERSEFVARNAPMVGTAADVIVLDACETSHGTLSAVRYALNFGAPVFVSDIAERRAEWIRKLLDAGKVKQLKGWTP